MNKKVQSRQKRHKRIMLRMAGTAEKPRLVVCRSLNNLSAQVVDDTKGKVLTSFATFGKAAKARFASGGNIKSAQALGEFAALELKEKGIKKIIFDRAGFLYHGRVKAFAEALRKGGLEF